jgi:hypothetical protein
LKDGLGGLIELAERVTGLNSAWLDAMNLLLVIVVNSQSKRSFSQESSKIPVESPEARVHRPAVQQTGAFWFRRDV